ncbi:hypothetical protein LCGC14_1656230, partial [marine sediment metagenome]
IYEMPDGSGFYIMPGRKRGTADGGSEPLVQQPIVYRSTGRTLLLFVDRSSAFAPRLMWIRNVSGTITLEWIELGLDGGPFKPGGDFGEANSTGLWFGKEFDLGAPGTLKLLREAEAIIDSGDANLTWTNQVQRDGAASENAGSGITSSSTQFFAAQKTARRVRPRLLWTGAGGYTPAGNQTRIRKVIYRGSWLPETADNLNIDIDVMASAQRRGVSPDLVRSELKALILSNSYPFMDVHGAAVVQVVINEATFTEASKTTGLEGRETVSLSLMVHELS